MLCIALALVASASFLTRSLDQIEHTPGLGFAHDHGLRVEVSLDHDHHSQDGAPSPALSDDHSASQDGHSPSQDGDAERHHVDGHHHHYGDGGGALLFAANEMKTAVVINSAVFGAVQSPPAGNRPFGTERPPRPALTQA